MGKAGVDLWRASLRTFFQSPNGIGSGIGIGMCLRFRTPVHVLLCCLMLSQQIMMHYFIVCSAESAAETANKRPVGGSGTANERPVGGSGTAKERLVVGRRATTEEEDFFRFLGDGVDDPVAVLSNTDGVDDLVAVLPNTDERPPAQPLATATVRVESLRLPILGGGNRSAAGRPVVRPTATTSANDSHPEGVQHPVVVRQKTNDRRSLQSPSPTGWEMESPPSTIIILPESSSLLPTPIKLVISESQPHPPMWDGNKTTYYLSPITDLLFDRSGSQLYYVVTDREIEFFTNPRYKSTWLSYRKANLEPIKQGLAGPVAGEVISYWWPKSSPPTGTRVGFPEECNDTMGFCHMTFMEGMDLPGDGTHLMISTRTDPPHLVYLSIADGSRTSIPMATSGLQTLALDPPKTTLYVTNDQIIMSIDVAETGIPTGGNEVATFATYYPPPIEGGLDPLLISPQSFVASGSCFYTLDNTHRRLLAVEIPTSSSSSSSSSSFSSSSFSFGLRGSFTVVVDGLNLNDTIFMQTFVATPDGCNVFISDVGRDGGSGYIRWVKVESPCKSGGTVQTLAQTPNGSMWGLSLQEEGGRMYLYVGTGKGEVYQMELNKFQLHSC